MISILVNMAEAVEQEETIPQSEESTDCRTEDTVTNIVTELEGGGQSAAISLEQTVDENGQAKNENEKTTTGSEAAPDNVINTQSAIRCNSPSKQDASFENENVDVEGLQEGESTILAKSEDSLDPETKAAADALNDLLPYHLDTPKVLLQQLNAETTEEKIKEYFSAYGEVKLVKIKMDTEGKSECFGFVLFNDDNDINKLFRVEHSIDGTAIKIQRILPSDSEKMKTKKLFVGGLPHALKEHHLRSYFEKFGKIQYFQFVMNKTTNIRKTYCFIVFEDADSVDKITEGKIPPNSVVHTVNGLSVDCKKKFDDDHPIQQKIKSRVSSASQNNHWHSYRNHRNYNSNYYNQSSYSYGSYGYPSGYEQYYNYYGYSGYYGYPGYSYPGYGYSGSYDSNYGPVKNESKDNSYQPY